MAAVISNGFMLNRVGNQIPIGEADDASNYEGRRAANGKVFCLKGVATREGKKRRAQDVRP